MNKLFKIVFPAIMFAAAVLTIVSSCKKEFDAPPPYAPVTNITANYTIAQLKAKHSTPGNIEKIDSSGDIIIRGIVIADDRSGNFYKTIIIQDSTGGIALLINGNSLYNTFPIGRELFVKANGLYISDYSSQIQLGGGIQTGSTVGLADIPASLLGKNIFQGTLNNVVVPKDVTPSQLGTTMQDKYQNTLVRLSNFEFAAADTNKTFASAGVTSPSSSSFNLTSCSDLSLPSSDPHIELYTSNYSNFASSPLPNGNGTITGVYVIFGSGTRFYKELIIRDTSDVKFYGGRCGSGGSTTTGTTLLSEDFESVGTAGSTPISLTGWKNISETGTIPFLGKTFNSNKYASITAFSSTQQQPVVKTWLITPAVNLDATANEVLTFKTIDGYDNGATLKVYYSNNYTGSATPWTSTWTPLSATISSGHTSGYAPSFLSSGNINLNAITGTSVYFAFVYEGGYSGGAKTTTFEVDDVKVVAP